MSRLSCSLIDYRFRLYSMNDINIIDKRTLKAVGQVVLATIYKESDGTIISFE